MIAKDFLQEQLPDGDFGDLVIKDGDFACGPSDEQHIADIVMGVPGWIKQFMLVGVDPYKYQNARGKEIEMNQNIKVQLQSDGYSVTNISAGFSDGDKFNIKHDATRV